MVCEEGQNRNKKKFDVPFDIILLKTFFVLTGLKKKKICSETGRQNTTLNRKCPKCHHLYFTYRIPRDSSFIIFCPQIRKGHFLMCDLFEFEEKIIFY
jgi:hypothetical protein